MRRVSNMCGRTKCPTDGRRVKKSKRQLSVATVRIWQTTNDKEYKILKFKNDKSNSIQVRSYCDVCYESGKPFLTPRSKDRLILRSDIVRINRMNNTKEQNESFPCSCPKRATMFGT